MTKSEVIELYKFLEKWKKGDIKPRLVKYEVVENKVWVDVLNGHIKIYFVNQEKPIKIFKNELTFEQFM